MRRLYFLSNSEKLAFCRTFLTQSIGFGSMKRLIQSEIGSNLIELKMSEHIETRRKLPDVNLNASLSR